MREAKFTKAPWRVSHMCQGRGAVGAAHRRSVAEVWALDDDVPQEEMEANARLIAAAPDGFHAAEAAYIAILQAKDWAWRLDNQHVLVGLRNFLAKALAEDAQDVRERYEAMAAEAK